MTGDFSLSARIKSEKEGSSINSSLTEITVAAFQGKGSKETGKEGLNFFISLTHREMKAQTREMPGKEKRISEVLFYLHPGHLVRGAHKLGILVYNSPVC